MADSRQGAHSDADVQGVRLLQERIATLERRLIDRDRELIDLRAGLKSRDTTSTRSATSREESEVDRLAERLATVLESAPDILAIAEPTGRLISLNRAGRSMLGVASDDNLAHHSYWDFCTEEAREALMIYAIPTALRDGTWSGDTVARRLDGSEFPTSTVVIAHPAPDGSLEFFSVFVRDASSAKQMAEQLRESQTMEAVGRLAGGVAHDFNNILTEIIGTTELLLSDIPADSPTRDDINVIRDAADRAASLTRQLLAYSRRRTLQPRVLALNAVVGNMEALLRRLIGENIALAIELGSDVREVKADLSQLEQVINNLAVNARDAMPGGGLLSITTTSAERMEASAIHHGLMQPGRYACLVVRDTGHGMDPATLAHCFEPFYTTKPQGTGAGLGLAIVYGIVKQSGGHIWGESAPGAGASFTIFLPLHEGELPSSAETVRETAASGKGVTVLLVEDEVHVRRVTARTLRLRGYDVLEAAHGDDALIVARTHAGTIDLLLTDMIMPQMSGTEVAQRLVEQRPDLRVLYASGYVADNVPGPRAAMAPRSAFIQKPFTAQLLHEKINELLGAD